MKRILKSFLTKYDSFKILNVPHKNNMEHVFDRLPFTVFRQVVDYLGALPHLPTPSTLSMARHFKEKYCATCGEYMTTRKYVSKSPIHLSCRQKWYTPDESNIKYYQVQYPSIFQILNGNDNRWRPVLERCPVVLYSKQTKNFYRMRISTNAKQSQRQGNAWVDYQYRVNDKIINVFYNPVFSVIPEMFRDSINLRSNRQMMIDLHHILSGATRLDFMERFQVHSKEKILEWILRFSPQALCHVHPQRFESLRRFLTAVKDNDVKYQAIVSTGPSRITHHHSKWFQLILYDYPHILDDLEERTIQRFFHKNRDWFMRYVRLRPSALEYVSLVYNRYR